VASGTGVCFGNSVDLTCNVGLISDNQDVVIEFTAPSTGVFQVDTNGMVGDTVMGIYDASGSLLGCNDDNDDIGGFHSQITLPLTESTTYLIGIEDWGNDNCATLSWVLNINEVVWIWASTSHDTLHFIQQLSTVYERGLSLKYVFMFDYALYAYK
jgi:hypothetical protein